MTNTIEPQWQRLWPLCPDPDDCAGHTPACMHVEGGPLVMACYDCIKARQASGLVFCLSDDREVHQFIWETWSDEQRSAHMERLTDRQYARRGTGKPPLSVVCTCVDWCGESSEAGCPSCVQRDCYLPCDAVGSGCGDFPDGQAKTCDDDCCAPWQWAAAASFHARIAKQRQEHDLG